ncbi:MAG: hypothetical protein KAW40_00885 [Candidatus Aenigmarchaeota archaeon]|nr:hypothetical protein [Candidatus Aenigmarchaeota archaeon]
MRAVVSTGFLLVMFIVLALAILIMSLPIVLRSIGLQEWGNLIEKVQNIQKYEGEGGVTLSLPEYIDRVEFIRGDDNEKCIGSVGVCGLCENLEGKTFITIRIDQKEKPSVGSVLWKLVTFRPNKAKADAVKMSLTDICYPKNFASSFQTAKYIDIREGTLVLEGNKNYCVKLKKTTRDMNIFVTKEGGC